LVRDSEGNLYGTASEGGGGSGCYYDAGCGLVFNLNPTGKITVLYTFPGGASGGTPWAGLVRDTAGNLYGGTWSGGDMSCNPPFGCGTIFKLDPSGNETVLYSFTASEDGGMPVGIVRDESGTIYGATQYGGGSANCGFGCGTVFKLEPDGTETVLHGFTSDPEDGAWPRGGVILDTAGNIYGTTEYGGANSCGVVFKLDAANKEGILHSFTCGNGDGASPTAGLIRDAMGNLYGTTSTGGDFSCGRGEGCGTAFKLTP
jgi:uncharacterized repeat protein (TIGR03803 family)